MVTRVFTPDETDGAAELILRGGLVIVPTETVYGLAANAHDKDAVSRLAIAKKRPDGKPFSWLVESIEPCAEFAEVTHDARRLADAFLPGPLTMVLRRLDGSGTVGVRVPAQETTLELLRKAGVPLACPSANPSGEDSPKSLADALRWFDGAVDGAIDGGECAVGTESTVVDMTVAPPKILRRGGLTKRVIERALGMSVDGMTVIGLTGGTGAGKTSALRAVQSLGGLVIDCDVTYHALIADSADMRRDIDARFPGVIVGDALDRRALGERVYADAAALRDLNAITHGYVREEVARLISDYGKSGGTLAAVDAIELFDSEISELCDVTVSVTAPESTRVRRIMERDGIDEARAKSRVAAQKPDSYYAARCDYILENEYGGADEFEVKCRELFKDIIGGKING